MADPSYIVFHYCDVDKFQNMLKSKVLWLCDLTDSNDDQEVSRTFDTLWEGVKGRLQSSDLDKNVLDEATKLIDQQYQVELKTDPPYGICFCKEEDISTQWREYGDSTRGVSLGFDINWFIKNGIRQQKPHPSSIQSNAIGCDGVIYHTETFEKQMTQVCYDALKQNGINAWLTLIRPTFKHYSGFVKNPTFNTEQEIRIVYFPVEGLDFTQKDVFVSELKTNGKKHYEIPWVRNDSMALKSICIGHNCSLKMKDILELLIQSGIKTDEIEIKDSLCSYRIRD